MGQPDSGSDPNAQIIVLRVVIRSPDVATFIAKYSRFIKDDRIFIFTKASQAPGTRVRFTLELADGPALIHGEGTVTRIRADQGDPSKPPGMELRFEPLDDESRAMVEKMLTARGGTSNMSLSQPIALSPPTHPGTNPGLDDASTKIRTAGMMPIHTPAAGTNLPPIGKRKPTESVDATDVDAGTDRKKFRLPPPAFTATPTPLPAPLPLPALLTPPHGAPLPNPTQPVLPALQATPPHGATGPAARVSPRSDETGAFATVGEAAPRFAESQGGTVPANPFSEISDGAIEYFVEWSMEQSTAAHPKSKPPASSTFANVPMARPQADPKAGAPASRLRLYIGIFVGLALGIPLGAVGMWSWRPMTPPASQLDWPKASIPKVAKKVAHPPGEPKPAAAPKPPVEAAAPAPVAPTEPPRPLAKVVEKAKAETPRPEKPDEAASPGPAELPPPPALSSHHAKTATLRVRSTPPGAEVMIKGEPHGNTPVDIELAPNHRYDVTIVSPGKPAWRKRINLKPPLTEISASFK